jgi:hypothetical protein
MRRAVLVRFRVTAVQTGAALCGQEHSSMSGSVLTLVFTFMLVTAPIFMFVLVTMPPTTSPGLAGVFMPPVSVRARPVHSVESRPMDADLPTPVIAAPLAADQRDPFNGERSS